MSKFKSDIEIARQAKMKPIQEILNGIDVPDKPEAYSCLLYTSDAADE